MTTILITTSNFDVDGNLVIQRLRDRGFELVVNPYRRRLTGEEATNFISSVKPIGIIAGVEPLGKQQFRAFDGLRVLSRCGTGLDNVDMSAAKEFGVSVFNTPEAPAPSVAELTLGLILCCLRQIPLADRSLRTGQWSALKGSLLRGKTVGVVGFGRIGRLVTRLVRAFEARVLAYDPFVAMAGDVAFVSLDDLLRDSDIVTLHMPYSAGAHHLFDGSALQRMKKGAILINASRGGLVDEAALLEALRTGHLSSAGLDVFEEEPYSGPLTGLSQVVLTAHMGSAARETRELMELEAARNLELGLRNAGCL